MDETMPVGHDPERMSQLPSVQILHRNAQDNPADIVEARALGVASGPSQPGYPWLKLLHLIWLVPLWTMQYAFVVPMVALWIMGWWLLKVTFVVGGAALILIWIPVIGWIIIIMMALSAGRRNPAPKKSHRWLFFPWAAAVLRSGR